MKQEAPSRAKEFFGELTSQSEEEQVNRLKGMINSVPPTFEEAWLDFKEGEPWELARLNGDDLKRTWSKGLGAMSNTEGGVIIWGIEAKKDPTKNIDSAQRLSLCPDASALASRLKELVHTVNDPPVPDVIIRPILTNGSKGFVACLIPKSRFKPHRSEKAGDQFYVRIQDHSVVPSLTWLKRMFEPELSPQFSGVAKTVFRSGGARLPNEVTVTLLLTNTGNGTADEPYVLLPPIGKLNEYVMSWERHETSQGYCGFSHKRSIHPGETAAPITVVTTQVDKPIDFIIQLFSRHQRPLSARVVFAPSDFLEHAEKAIEFEPI